MAGRKDKTVVDYFPHYCMSGKTMFIIESKFGHIGYSIWFKTLELLGSSENHYIDLREETDLLFLISKLKITESELLDIYNLLSKLNAIDADLWNNKIIFSENFLQNIQDAYKRRTNKCMHKLDLCKHLNIKCPQIKNIITHKSTKESKVNKRKEDNIEPKKEPKFNFKKSLLDLGVKEEILNDWLIVREKKKASNTETAFKAIKKQIELKVGKTANDCIEKATEKDWKGFSAGWDWGEDESTGSEQKKVCVIK